MSGKMRNREQFCYVVGCLLLFPAVFLGICPLTWWVGVLCSLLGLCVVILGASFKSMFMGWVDLFYSGNNQCSYWWTCMYCINIWEVNLPYSICK